MALGGNPVFNGKNFRGATQAPYGQSAYGQAPYGQAPGRAPGQVMDAQGGWSAAQQGMTQDQLQEMYNRPAARCRVAMMSWGENPDGCVGEARVPLA